MKTAELRAFMKDVDPASLPSVAEAKAQQRARQAQQKIQPEPPQPLAPVPIYDVPDSTKQKKMAIEREDATDPKVQKRQIEDQQNLAAQAKEQTELSERFLATLQRDHEAAEKLKEAELRAGQKAAQEADITDARRRYLQAAEHLTSAGPMPPSLKSPGSRALRFSASRSG